MQDAGGNDIWFGSDESSRRPELIIETSGGGTDHFTLSSHSDATASSTEPVLFGGWETPWLWLDQEMDEGTASSGTIPLVSPPPRIRFTRLNPTKVELAWDVVTEADYEIQIRRSWNDGQWTTIHRTTASPGTFRIPLVVSPRNAFLRVVRIDRGLSAE